MTVRTRNPPKKATKAKAAPAKKRRPRGSASDEDSVFSVPFTGTYPQLDSKAKLLPLFAC